MRCPRFAIAVPLVLSIVAIPVWVWATQAPGGKTSVSQPAFAAFLERIDEYVALHQKIEKGLPRLSKEATPQEIDRNQRSLGEQIATARRGARQGDVLIPEMQTYVRGLLKRIFGGPAGRQLRSSIMDENPVKMDLRINQRYPDTVPLSTMPPEVLAALPKLPEEIEYRFIWDQLILLDPHAHIIIDYLPDAIPGLVRAQYDELAG